VRPEELKWRADYAAADEAAKAAERRALEAELRANEMKNELQTSSSVAERNSAAAALEAQGKEVREARAEAAAVAFQPNEVRGCPGLAPAGAIFQSSSRRITRAWRCREAPRTFAGRTQPIPASRFAPSDEPPT
jgi:hypothetical protein